MLAQLEAKYPDDLRVVYRHFPLVSIHDKALLATQAAEAAGLQGKFWEMHDLLFATFNQWTPLPVADFQAWLSEQAATLELDVAQFEVDLTSEAMRAIAGQGWADGQAMGFPGTPFLVINSLPYDGPVDSYNLSLIIDLIRLEDRQYNRCPEAVIDPLKQYQATIELETGNVVIELYPEVAPLAVNSFVFLARDGWFDGATFHRVLPGYVAQAGDPTGTGLGGPGYAFRNETSPNLSFDSKGLLAMANSGPDTNGSQFFITYAPTPNLDGSYTIFGRVIEGMELIDGLTPRDPSKNPTAPAGDPIITITITEQ